MIDLPKTSNVLKKTRGHNGSATPLIAHSTNSNPTEAITIIKNSDHRTSSTRPFNLRIDQLSITFNDPTDPDHVIRSIHSISQQQYRRHHLNNGRFWKLDCLLSIADHNGFFKTVLFQVGSRNSARANYRLDFNPSKLGPTGVGQLIQFLEDAGLTLSLIGSAAITRIDLALDLFGLTADEVIVQGVKQQKHGVYSDRRVVPQSVIIGSPRSSSKLVAYTKPYKEAGDEYLRLERRLKPRLPFCNLASLSNPFDRVRIITTDMLPSFDGVIPQLLADSIRIRGLSRAIKPLPSTYRSVIRKAVDDGTRRVLPSMDDIWALWPNAVIESGLVQLTDRDNRIRGGC